MVLPIPIASYSITFKVVMEYYSLGRAYSEMITPIAQPRLSGAHSIQRIFWGAGIASDPVVNPWVHYNTLDGFAVQSGTDLERIWKYFRAKI